MGNLVFLVIIDSLIWIVYSVIIGFLVTKIGTQTLKKIQLLDIQLEGTKGFCDAISIKRWKDKVPEAGSMFKGGVSKKSLIGMDDLSLENYAAETKRAEIAHYLFLFLTPVFFLFNPWFLSLAMVIYAVIANIPCILIQRYNRARIYAILKK